MHYNISAQDIDLIAKSIANKSDREKMNLKGTVKSIKEFCYNCHKKSEEIIKGDCIGGVSIIFDQNGNKIEEINYTSPQKIKCKYDFLYDRKGNQSEKKIYNSEGVITEKSSYRYDTQRNKIEETILNSDGKIIRKESHKYDTQSNKIEKVIYNPEKNVVVKESYSYGYDAQGNIIEKVIYTSEGRISHKVKYTYDEFGNKIEEIHCGENGSIFEKKKYKHLENVTEVYNTYYHDDGLIDYVQNCIYDKNGYLIGDPDYNSLEFDDKGNLVSIQRDEDNHNYELEYYFSYEFDNAGNWIKRSEFESTAHNDYYYGEKIWTTSSNVFITERKIEYYLKRNTWWNIFRGK